MPIKDLEKRKEYQRELMRKRRNEGLTENVSPDNLVRPNLVSPEKVVSPKNNSVSPMLDPNPNVSPSMLDQWFNKSSGAMLQGLTVRPNEKMLDPVRPLENVSPCSHCPEIENSISELTNLYQQEQEKIKELQKQLQELQKPINSTIELWKGRYSSLEKEFGEKGAEQAETIIRLKEKLWELTSKNQEWEQKYRNLENTSKNKDNSLSIADLNNLISKYQRLRNIQHRYSSEEVRELRFIKELYQKLWPLISLVP